MKIVLIAHGPLDHIAPFHAFAKKLREVGHEVRLCSHDLFEKQLQSSGIDYRPIGPKFHKEDYGKILDQLVNATNPMQAHFLGIEQHLIDIAKEWHYGCWKAMKGCDLAIVQAYDIPAQEAAMKHKLPWISVTLQPGRIKTRFEAPSNYPTLVKGWNLLLWKINEWYCRWKYDRTFNEFIRGVGGKERKNIAYATAYSRNLNLIAASPALCGDYPDRPDHFLFTGAWLPDHSLMPMPSGLGDFLEKHPDPVVITFSSLSGRGGQKIAQTLIGGVRSLAIPAVIVTGWLDIPRDDREEQLIYVEDAPYRELFPRAGLIFHHGDAFATQSAASFGKLQLIAPYLPDQYYWGRQLIKHGILTAIPPLHGLTSQKVADMITKALENRSLQDNALVLMEKMSTEQGLECALDYVVSFARERGILH